MHDSHRASSKTSALALALVLGSVLVLAADEIEIGETKAQLARYKAAYESMQDLSK